MLDILRWIVRMIRRDALVIVQRTYDVRTPVTQLPNGDTFYADAGGEVHLVYVPPRAGQGAR